MLLAWGRVCVSIPVSQIQRSTLSPASGSPSHAIVSVGSGLTVNGGGMLGHWGGVKLYHLVCSCSAKKSSLTGQHKCPHHLLREMACLRVCQWRRHVGPLGRSKTVPPGVFMFSEKIRANWPA